VGMREMLDNDANFLYYDRWSDLVPQVEYMIVDEAQDFDSEDINKLKNAAETAVYFFGDSAQSLYRFNKNTISMSEISQRVGIDSPELLMHNYRLPKKVARIAEKIANINDLEWRCVKKGEHLPEKIQCPTYDAELDKIKEIIENQKLTSVCILFPSNGKVRYAYHYLKEMGLNIEAKFDFKDGGSGYKKTHLDLNFASDNPKLMTYHSSKGLQFETVFIPEPQIFERDEAPRNPLYVAMTRTSDRLYFLYSGQEPDIFDEIPVDYFNRGDNIVQI
jgi:superfamily I DNA/RNA helicase